MWRAFMTARDAPCGAGRTAKVSASRLARFSDQTRADSATAQSPAHARRAAGHVTFSGDGAAL